MKKMCVLILGLFPALSAAAQDTTLQDTPPPLISGYADVYYKYNFNENVTDNKTSFTNAHNSFELGMISVKVQHSFGQVSLLGDLGFGKRAQEFSYNDEGSSLAVKQLYLSYAPADWISFSMGSFATHVGYELVDANLNRNYSMSYMFSYGPFFHTGLKVNFTAGANTFMAGVFNPTDYKYAPLDSKKYLGAQWGFHPEGSGFQSYLNYIGGKDMDDVRNDQFDLVITYQLGEQFSLGYNGTYSHYKLPGGEKPSWWGSALYLNGDFNDHAGLTLRGEYFSDQDGLKVFTDTDAFPDGGQVLSLTLSLDYKIGPLTLIPELRLDNASEKLFNKPNGNPVKSSPSALFAAIYTFGG